VARLIYDPAVDSTSGSFTPAEDIGAVIIGAATGGPLGALGSALSTILGKFFGGKGKKRRPDRGARVVADSDTGKVTIEARGGVVPLPGVSGGQFDTQVEYIKQQLHALHESDLAQGALLQSIYDAALNGQPAPDAANLQPMYREYATRLAEFGALVRASRQAPPEFPRPPEGPPTTRPTPEVPRGGPEPTPPSPEQSPTVDTTSTGETAPTEPVARPGVNEDLLPYALHNPYGRTLSPIDQGDFPVPNFGFVGPNMTPGAARPKRRRKSNGAAKRAAPRKRKRKLKFGSRAYRKKYLGHA